MKNSECQIYIDTKNTRSVFAKEGDHWVVTSSQGRHFTASAEQVLSHILPPLAGVSRAKVTVVKKT